MYIKSSTRRAKANTRGRRIVAEEVVEEEKVEEVGGDVEVDPAATDLVFEAEDVAELLAEITEQDIEVTADENEVTFTVGDTDFTVQAEGEEEILETSRRVLRGKRPVKASRSLQRRKPVAASTKAKNRTVRRVQR